MATIGSTHGLQGPLRFVKNITGWYVAAAVLFIVLGVIAIVEPAVAGLGVTLLVGWLLIFGGATHLIGAFKGGGAKQVIFQVLIGIVYVIGGLFCLMHPILAISTLTLVLAAVILCEGVLEVVSYFRLKGEDASSWLLLNGIITLILGAMIWFHWPSSSIWAIGILVGTNLLLTGVTRLMFGLAARRLIKGAATGTGGGVGAASKAA
jgi:uncharacterized membrane protein HdeD (DUF308 family)